MRSLPPELPFNPFVDVAVGDPRLSREPDVATINARAFHGLLDIIRQIGTTPHAAALVLGDAGTGKTHLIKRLFSNDDHETPFVYVNPMKDHRRMSSRLMESVAASLEEPLRTGSAGMTRLDLIVARVLLAGFERLLIDRPDDRGRIYLQTIRKDPLKIFSFRRGCRWGEILKTTEELLKSLETLRSRTARMLLKVLFQYCEPAKREAVGNFLTAAVPDEEESRALGLRFTEADMSDESHEERSKDILVTVGAMLRFFRPMVLCFDQLENLDTPELARAFGKLVAEIVNEAENIVPVGFVRPERWDNHLKPQLDPAAEQRLTGNIFLLEGCTLSQGLEIVQARLAWAYEGVIPPPAPFHPLDGKLLAERLRGVTSPREVLLTANRLLSATPEVTAEDPVEVVARVWQAERERLRVGLHQEPSRREVIVAALKICFEARAQDAGYHILELVETSGADLSMKVRGERTGGRDISVDLTVETALHWNPLTKTLASLEDRLRKGMVDAAIVVRDARNPIPPREGAMPKTVDQLHRYQDAGGLLCYLDYDNLTRLYALVHACDMVRSGDLSYTANSAGEQRLVNLAMFGEFASRLFECEVIGSLERGFLPKPPAHRQASG